MAKEFRAPGKDVIQKIWQEFGLNEQRVKESVEALKNWLAMEPHLPEESGSLHDARLERWLIRCKNSMERTKQSIDFYYTLKSLSPDMMCNWNPRSKWYQDAVEIFCFFPMPELTPEGDRVIIFKYLTKDATKFVPDNLTKVCLMTSEVRMCEEYCSSDIFIFDMQNYTLGHASKVTFTSVKKGEVCVMIYVHGKDLTNFTKQVPQMCLPDDLGGTGGSLQENWSNLNTRYIFAMMGLLRVAVLLQGHHFIFTSIFIVHEFFNVLHSHPCTNKLPTILNTEPRPRMQSKSPYGHSKQY
ncbi:uncharacterized protein [Periplaneta americana]|uniref:uncharacterized protein isoform X3 n=1 Tax=Periplaneta americana TaxID=6978 RepID=UPI0037E7AA82